MTNSLESLATYAASLIAMEPWRFDNRCIPIPWRSITLPPVLCFAILYDDNVVRPFPPIIRALKQVAERLKAAGHEVLEWDAEDLYEEGTKILHKLYEADGGQTIRSHFDASDEPWPGGLARYEELSKDADKDLVSGRSLCMVCTEKALASLGVFQATPGTICFCAKILCQDRGVCKLD